MMAERLTQIEKLNGKNYQSWKYNMKLVLMEKGLWGIADGSEVKEEDDANADAKTKAKTLKEWNLRSDKAYSMIALAVEHDLQVHINGTTSAKEAWEKLQNHFNVVSVAHVVRLSRRFYAAEMREEDDLFDFITKMTAVAQELRELKEDISEKKFATTILGALPESYESFLSGFNTIAADELKWDNVKGLLTEEYFKRKEKVKQSNALGDPIRSFRTEDAMITTQGERGRSMHRGGARRSGSRVSGLIDDEAALFSRSSSRGRSAPPRGRGSSFGRNTQSQRNQSFNQQNTQSLDRNSNPKFAFQGNCFNCRRIWASKQELPFIETKL